MTRLIPLLILLWPAVSAGDQSVGHGMELSDAVTTGNRYMQIRLLGSLGLRGSDALSELSGLAWDEDEETLYAVSDRGVLLHLYPEFDGDRLTGLRLGRHFPLLNNRGKPLKGHWRDSEGLALEQGANGTRGDSRLLISFERHNRIERYRPNGEHVDTVSLPPGLERKSLYPARNKGLEAVTLHPVFGTVSAPEQVAGDGPIGIYSAAGARWDYRPFEPDGGVVALETLPDGDILILERAFSFPLSPMVISLARFHPDTATAGTTVTTSLLARFDSTEGWRTQNFEGLTRHRDNRFFMVSDDGGYTFLATQLVYFELIE